MSTPKNTSPIGFDLVRITWFSAAPASPDCRIFTLTPVCFVNAASTDFDTANESWVTRVIVVADAADAADHGERERAARRGDGDREPKERRDASDVPSGSGFPVVGDDGEEHAVVE